MKSTESSLTINAALLRSAPATVRAALDAPGPRRPQLLRGLTLCELLQAHDAEMANARRPDVLRDIWAAREEIERARGIARHPGVNTCQQGLHEGE